MEQPDRSRQILEKTGHRGGFMIDIRKEIQMEDLPPVWQKIAKVVGIQGVIDLYHEVGGSTVYVPKPDTAEIFVIKRLIQQEYKAGHSISDIARRYQLDARTVKKYIKQNE